MKSSKKQPYLILLIVLAVLVVLGAAAYGSKAYQSYQAKRAQMRAPAAAGQAVQDETAALVAKVGAHVVLPTDEVPTIATVEDPSKLKGQAFFLQAKKGDKVLLYAKARKAILYRPSVDRLIEIAPLTVGSGGTASSSVR